MGNTPRNNGFPDISKPRPKATELLVPVGMWKGGMYCIEIPQIRLDPNALVPKIWSHSKSEAEEQAREAIKNFQTMTKSLSIRDSRKADWKAKQAELTTPSLESQL